MLYRITHLKAPWPAGAAVGDVVDMPAVPDWATGKCQPAEDGAVASVSFAPAQTDDEREFAEADARIKAANAELAEAATKPAAKKPKG